MSNVTNDLVMGIVSGIFTSILIFVAAQVTSKVIAPAIRAFFYKGPDIPGHWNFYASYDSTAQPVGAAEVEQQAERVKVTLKRHTSRLGQPANRRFEYQGKFAAGQLTVLFEDIDMRRLITGAVVLKLSFNNRVFLGKTVYLDHDMGVIVAHNLWLRHISST
jgi:hypothetical protein